MSGINRVILIGRVGKNPEVNQTQNGKSVAKFSVATSETWKDASGERNEKTDWHNIVAWGKLAEICEKYLEKGKQVYVEGKLQTRSWDDKDGNKRYTTEIVASQMQMLSPSGKVDQPQDQSGNYSGGGGFGDIPFDRLNEWGC